MESVILQVSITRLLPPYIFTYGSILLLVQLYESLVPCKVLAKEHLHMLLVGLELKVYQIDVT